MSAGTGQAVVAAGAGRSTGTASLARALPWIIALGVTFLSYAGTLGYEFVYDDRGQIVGNPYLRSWHYFPHYFASHVWGHIDPSMYGNYYRPMFLVWLLINHSLFGLKPALWHLTTVLAHAGATFMVFALARRLLKSPTAAAVAALVFGLHPTHVESVAWVSGVTDPLLALFFLPSFLFYLDWRNAASIGPGEYDGSRLWRRPAFKLSLSLLFFGMALLSKETALVMPILVFGVEWIYGDGTFGRRIAVAARASLPFAALVVPYLVVRSLVLKGVGHQLSPVSVDAIVRTWPSALWFYVTHLVWPVKLSCFYDLAFVNRLSLTEVFLPLAGLLLVVSSLWLVRRRCGGEIRQMIAVSCLLLALPVLPVLNLSIFADGELVHDRYLYLPTIGLAMLVGLGVSRLNLGSALLFGRPAAPIVLSLVLMAGLGSVTISQHQYWASELLLFQHGLTIAPESRIARTGLANVLSDRRYFDAAVEMYNEVIARYPNNWKAVNNLGCTYMAMGNFALAEKTLTRAIEIKPSEPKQYISLSVTLQELNRLPEAGRAAEYAISLDPEGYGFYYQWGDLLESQGRLPEALEAYQREAANHPEFTQAQERAADLRSRLGMPPIKEAGRP